MSMRARLFILLFMLSLFVVMAAALALVLVAPHLRDRAMAIAPGFFAAGLLIAAPWSWMKAGQLAHKLKLAEEQAARERAEAEGRDTKN
jgi:predicted MFS family arabinose efflux permease